MTTSNPLLDGAAPQPISPRKVPVSFLVTFALASFGLWIATLTPVIVTLPLKISQINPDPKTQGITLSLVLGIGAIFGILSNPIFGRISDRTTWRAGMRRPWLVIGALISLIGAIILGLSTDAAVATIGWALNQIGVNATLAVLLALLPDQVPSERRGMVSGLSGLAQAVAGLAGVGLVAGLSTLSLTAAIVVPTIIAFVFVTLAAILLKDRQLTEEDRPPFGLGEFFRSFWVNPAKHPDFGWAWISRFAIFMSISLVLNYQIFYLTSHIGLTKEAATAIIPASTAFQTVGIILASLLLGRLSDRLGRRRIFVLIAALIAAIGLAIVAFAPPSPASVPLFFVALFFVGLGQGTYFSVDLALVADVLPNKDKDAAKDLGVLGMANLIPQSLAPAIAPAFLVIPLLAVAGHAGQNYTALFLAGVVFAVISGITILRVKGVR